MRAASLATLGLALVIAAPAAADPQAQVVLVNLNVPGVGLDDPTPVAPVGGNPGTTLGAQRTIALQHGAEIWARNLRSHVPIRIQVAFTTRACNATSAVLASAGALVVNLNFKHGELADTWYHGGRSCRHRAARARARPRVLAVREPDHRRAVPRVAGRLQPADPGSDPDLTWDQMTNAQRVASAINSRKVVWTGPHVTRDVPRTLALGVPVLRISTPAVIAGTYDVGPASFGAPFTAGGVTGNVVLGLDAADAAGPSATDACSAITNPVEVAGRIALVDRGTCGFVIKVKNLQDAGAIAVLVADNAPGSPPAALGGADPTITIPSARITLADGIKIKAQLGAGVGAKLLLDTTLRAGAAATGQALLNAPDPVVPGSSISHWDPIASPNLLMEPAINADVDHGLDLTKPLLHDLGWQIDRSRGNGR